MDISRLLSENEIAVYVLYDTVSKIYTVCKNDSVELSDCCLFDWILFNSDHEYLESVKNEELLPRLWSQGASKCCIFPTSPEKIVCLFFESDLDNVQVYPQCKKYMELFSQIQL